MYNKLNVLLLCCFVGIFPLNMALRFGSRIPQCVMEWTTWQGTIEQGKYALMIKKCTTNK